MISDQSTVGMENSASRIMIALAALSFIYVIVLILLAGTERLIAILTDDSGYFLEIAENVARGNGLSFDGIHRTNGFQPLWLYTLAALQWIFRANPNAMLKICVTSQAVLFLAAGVVIYSHHGRFFSKKTGLVSAIAFIVFVFFHSINGMESALLVLLLGILLVAGRKGEVFTAPRRDRQFLFGIILGIVVLARLDNIFLVLSIFLFCLGKSVRDRGRGAVGPAGLLLIMCGTGVIVAPYLAFNLARFGSIMPVSGALKSSFPHVTGPGHAFARLGVRVWAEVGAAALYLAWHFVRAGRSRTARNGRSYFRACLAVMSLAVLFHFAYTVLFMKWAIFKWHFITYAVLGALVISEPVEYLVARLRGRSASAAYWIVVAALVLSGGWIVARRHFQPLQKCWTVESYRAALWARRNTSETDVFAMSDAGIFGYFSGRRVINLDGVVNDMSYQEVLRERRLGAYLETNRVRYIVQHAFWNREEITEGLYDAFPTKYISHKYDVYSDEILLERSSEVYRSEPYFDGPYRTVFLIWEIRGGAPAAE